MHRIRLGLRHGEKVVRGDVNSGVLAGKGIVIIGGTSGLGLSAARAFVAVGAHVTAVGLDPESVAEASNQLGSSARVIGADARKPDTAAAAIAACVSAFGTFDGLYHVAGGSGRRFGDGPLHEISEQGWETTLQLNLTSVFLSNRAAVNQFLLQKTGGSILNISSVLAWSPEPKHFATHAYAAAKAAVIGFSKSCAAFYAPQSIRFNVLAPGLVATPMSKRAQQDPAITEFIYSKQPLDGGRIGRAGDLDAAAVFFMSDASRFTTGQVLAVDGGWTVRG